MKKKRLHIVVDVLQNGSPICHIKKPLSFGCKIKISPQFNESISIPFYNLPKELLLLKVIQNQKAELYLTLPFSGILTSKDKIIYLKDSSLLGQTYLLGEGDYASLAYRDLRFLIRVQRVPLQAPSARRNPQYYPKFSKLIFRDKFEGFSVGIGAFVSVFLFACLLSGFLLRQSDTTKGLEVLEKKYVLPFLSPTSLNTLPEALKFHLDRTKYIPSLVKYYQSVTSLFNDWPIENESFLFESSIELAKREHSDRQKRFEDLVAKQKAADLRADAEASRGSISIPTTYDSNFQNKLLETIRKVDSMQLGFKLALESRRRFLVEFLEDAEYEWGNYAGGNRKQDKKSADPLSKIVVFGQLNNEKFMYDVGKRLGESADIIQRYLDRRRTQPRLLDESTLKTLYMPVGADFASASLDVDFSKVDRKMGTIKAVTLPRAEPPSKASIELDMNDPILSDEIK